MTLSVPRFLLLENGDDHSTHPVWWFEDLTKGCAGRAWPAGRAESASALGLLIPNLSASLFFPESWPPVSPSGPWRHLPRWISCKCPPPPRTPLVCSRHSPASDPLRHCIHSFPGSMCIFDVLQPSDPVPYWVLTTVDGEGPGLREPAG